MPETGNNSYVDVAVICSEWDHAHILILIVGFYILLRIYSRESNKPPYAT
jgi:hypothetical protein